MRAMQMVAQNAKLIEILGRTLAELLERVIDLVCALAKMRMDLDVQVTGGRRP